MKNTLLTLALITIVAIGFPPPEAQSLKFQYINIEGMKFVPNEITVNKGDVVVWTNKSSMRHDVVSKKFKSRLLLKGESFSVKMEQVGTFDYYCTPHKSMGMVGKIIVR